MKTCHRYRCYVINQVFISRLQGCVHFCYSSFVLFTRIATYINRVVSRDCCKQCFCIVYSKWIMTVGNNSAGVSSCDAIFGICVWKTERIINTTYIRRKFFFCCICSECVLVVATCVEEPGVGYDEVYIFIRGGWTDILWTDLMLINLSSVANFNTRQFVDWF